MPEKKLNSNLIRNAFEEAQKCLNDFCNYPHNLALIEQLVTVVVETIKSGNKVITCGNGGSMCDAMHFAEELTGKYKNDRVPLPAIAISDPAYITCTGNDYGYEFVFSRFIQGIGKKGDLLLAISTSGNSENIINAVKTAKTQKMYAVALLGNDGGHLKNIVDLPIVIEATSGSARIQEMHIKIIHITIELIEKTLEL